jgi:hypothetical protein
MMLRMTTIKRVECQTTNSHLIVKTPIRISTAGELLPPHGRRTNPLRHYPGRTAPLRPEQLLPPHRHSPPPPVAALVLPRWCSSPGPVSGAEILFPLLELADSHVHVSPSPSQSLPQSRARSRSSSPNSRLPVAQHDDDYAARPTPPRPGEETGLEISCSCVQSKGRTPAMLGKDRGGVVHEAAGET